LGFAAIAGHIWTVFLKFKGGKGVATTIGVVATLAPGVFIPAALVWLVVFSLTSYVSVASISFGIALPIFSILFNRSIYLTCFVITLCFINSYKHRENIRRLIRGEESKTTLFKK
jgi:glycerol-3-phosphate acyltransferase PlsY